MESYVSFDQFSTKQVVDGSMAGIGLWDKTETVIGKIDPATGKNWTGGIPEFYGAYDVAAVAGIFMKQGLSCR